MNEERLEQELREYFQSEAKKAEPSSGWWSSAVARVNEREQSQGGGKFDFFRRHPAFVGAPLSLLLCIVLIGGILAGLVGGMSPPPPSAPTLVSDGDGGTILVWLDHPFACDDAVIRAQHIDAQGHQVWEKDGIEITSGRVGVPFAVGDGEGGVIVGWWLSKTGTNIVRLGSDGSTAWALDGSIPWEMLGMVEDASGGAILLLDDGNGMLHVQRVSGEGALVWGVGDVSVGTTENSNPDASIASDGAGGAVVAWPEERGANALVHVQRVSGDGQLLWADGGILLATVPGGQAVHTQVVSNGIGDYFISWDTGSSGLEADVFAQKLDSEGGPLWGVDGIEVCEDQVAESYSPANFQSHPQMAPDGSGGVVVAWHDRRRILNREVFVQRLSASGDALWAEDGVWVWDVPVEYPKTAGILSSAVVGEGTGGAIVVWTGYGAPVGNRNSVIYSQKLDSDGMRSWPADVPYRNPRLRSQGHSSMISDRQGGVIVSSRVGESTNLSMTNSVYAQRIDSQGSYPWGDGGIEVRTVRSARTVQLIAVGAIVPAILVLVGVIRKRRIARLSIAAMPVVLGIAGLFSMLLVIGPFGYSYWWAYIADTPVNRIAAFVVPVIGLAIGAVSIHWKMMTLWVMVPVTVFCALVATSLGLALVLW